MGSGKDVSRLPRWAGYLTLCLLALFAAACEEAVEETPAPSPDVAQAPAATSTPEIPTLLPTYTRAVQPTATPPTAAEISASPSPAGTVDFEQPVVEFRYRIPALALDRRLEGNVNGQVTVVDETIGLAAIRQNQGGVLLELQSALPSLELEPLPEDCQACVAFSYELPLENVSGEGWLQDPVLLASVENYGATMVGPHFPPGTVLGLRRSATPYDVAHTLALTADGQLWRWLATEPQISAPVAAAEVAPQLDTLLQGLAPESLSERYEVQCPGAPAETLYLNPDNGEAEEEGTTVRLACPAFSLPDSLHPLYLQLNVLLEEILADQGLPRPPSEIPLATVIDYRRQDQAHLTMLADGVTRAESAGETYTITLSPGQVVSLTTSLVEQGQLQPGLQAYVDGEAPNVLLVRGPQGMLEAAWEAEDVPQAIRPQVTTLDQILDELLEAEAPAEEGTTTPSPTPTATSTATSTPAP